MRALIVDDSDVMRKILHGILHGAGFEIDEAEHAAAALASLDASGPIDVALIDWNMPNTSGLNLVQTIRSDPRYDAMPLMMVTIETEMDNVRAALDAGANEYVMKPFTHEAIIEKLVMIGVLET